MLKLKPKMAKRESFLRFLGLFLWFYGLFLMILAKISPISL